MNRIVKYSKTAAFLAGALSVPAFAPYYCTGCAFLSLGILLYLLLKAEGYRRAFGIGYAFGFSHFALGFSWVGNALLIEPEKFGWLYPITLAAAGGFFGLFVALPAMLSFFAEKNWQKWLSFAAWFVVFEWVRSFLFTGFPWNLSGYILAFNDNLIQAASVGGAYLLSLAVVLTCSIWGLWAAERNIKVFAACAGWIVLVILCLLGGGVYRLGEAKQADSDVIVRIVQPSIPQQMKWNRDILEANFQSYLDLSSVSGEQEPDFIVWGETASPFRLDVDEEHAKQAARVIPDKGYLITGMISVQAAKGGYLPHNSMAVIDKTGTVRAYYHKSHLVPFGEYIPLREYLPEFVRPVANAIGTFGRGNGPEKIVLSGLPALGGIICYEAIFPHEVVNQAQRPDFLVNLTNDGWYGHSAGPYQHWAATRFRAVEEGIVIVRAANNGISGVIDAYGRVKAMLPLDYTGTLDVRLPELVSHATFYSRFGNSVILTFCLILLFLGSIKVKNRRFGLK